jgi:hypothetical protein
VVKWALVWILAPVLAGSGCGYQIVRYRDALGDARRVAIVGLENNSFEPYRIPRSPISSSRGPSSASRPVVKPSRR